MKVIEAMNVNTAYSKGMRYLHDFGITRQSRNGQVLVAPGPVTTHYRNPRERVLFSPQRDANPFFHLFESLWMLTGANDVALPRYFVKNMQSYSDDGLTFHGAYGHRWREHFKIDQLDALVHHLQSDPDSRRAILQIWDVDVDLAEPGDGLDIPCNDMVKFEITKGFQSGDLGARVETEDDQLNMVVFNRSNDVIWGCYGANAVQFSILQEYMAAQIGCSVGWYEQVSTNYHAYEKVWDKHFPLTDTDPFHDPYRSVAPVIRIETLVTDVNSFDDECKHIVAAARAAPHIISDYTTEGFHNRFFHRVCNPMLWSYANFRAGQLKSAIGILETAIAESGEIDWLVAGEQWMRRRAAIKMMVGERV